MRGEAAVENDMDEDEHGGNSVPTEAGKRRSVAMLKSMLENSSQGPLFQQYNNGAQELLHSSPQSKVSENSTRTNPFYSYYLESSSNGRITEDSGRESEATNTFIPSPDYSESPTVENGANFSEPQHQTYEQGDNLFQTNFPAHSSAAKGDFHNVTIKPPDFISRNASQTQDFSKPLKENGFDSLKDEDRDLFYTAKGKDLQKTQHPREVTQLEQSSLFVDPFKAPSNKSDLFQFPQNVPAKPFYKPKAAEADLFESVPKGQELFSVEETRGDTPNADDIFGKPLKTSLDAFSSSSTSTFDPFSSPLPGNLFDVASLEDPFGPTPLKQQDPFQGFSFDTPDIFKQRGPWTEENDIFSTSLISGPSEVELGTPTSTDLLKRTPSKLPPVVPPKPLAKPRVGLQPTPFSQAGGVSPSPNLSPTEGSHFKRPPRPLPRMRRHKPEIPSQPETHQPETALKPQRPPQPETALKPQRPPQPEPSLKPQRPPQPEPSLKPQRPPQPETSLKPQRPPQPETSLKPERPPQPETPVKPQRPPQLERPPQPEISVSPLTQTEPEPDSPKPPPKPIFKRSPKPPKPVFRLKPKSLETKLISPENYVMFEDVLLIGQEQCVEDWPEDSPELDPNFKPSGKIKLRRDSILVHRDSDGGSSEDPDSPGGRVKKKNRNLRMSVLSRRTSKDKSYDAKDRSNSLPLLHKSKDASEATASGGENDYDFSGMDYKKKPKNTKVSNLFRRVSSASVGHLPQESKNSDFKKSNSSKKNGLRRYSDDKLDDGIAEEEEADYKKRKGKMKNKRGSSFSTTKDEPKGAYGYTPRKGSKEKSLDEDFGGYGYMPRDKSKDYMLDDDVFKKKSSFSAEELDDEELNGMDDWKPKKSKHKNRHPVARKPRRGSGLNEGEFAEDEVFKKDARSLREMYDVESDELGICKPKKTHKLKIPKKHKSKSTPGKGDDPEEGSSTNLSEAAKAEWMAAQKDEGLVAGLDEDEEEDGDTDSLMEWWYTVEQWDELPSDEEDAAIKEDESKSFTILAGKVERGLRVFNKVFMEQAEVFWGSIISLHALADDISEFHQKAKIAGITGGTTTAVGSVAAIAGLVLAPLTFGASLAITAVGVGVATAGGITSASAAISDNVNNMQDRKKVEVLLKEYEDRMLDIAKILHFVNQGLYKLRGHPFLRSGTQHYSEDWEIRKAVQVIGHVDTPVMRAKEITDDAVASLQGLFKGIDKYFVKESRELKKGYKTQIAAEIRQVANVLNDCLVELNEIREDLHKATGY